MKTRKLQLLTALMVVSLFSWGPPVPAAVITLPSDETIDVQGLLFEKSKAVFKIGTESRILSREEMKDLSFTATKQEAGELATDVADLPGHMEKAREMLAKFPDSKAILVLDQGEFRHRPDGTNVNRYRGIIFLAKEEALGAAGLTLWFDPHRERVRILHARSYSPEGRVSSISPDQIKVSKGSSSSVSFDQIQQISVTIPEANVGSLIDYEYETEEYNPVDKNLFQTMFFFQGDDPVVESILKVVVPKEMPLYYHGRNNWEGKEKPVISEQNGEMVHTWTYTDVPPIVAEVNMPPFREVAPFIAVSLQKDWTYLYNRLKPMIEKRLQLTDLVKKKVDELVAGAKDLSDKIARIYLFCQKEIRYISIKGNLSSNQVGHPAEETLKNRYGDCTDKGMLFATMLKHIGVEAYPVLVLTNSNGKRVTEVPIFDADHCITEVHLDGKIFFLDSTATDYRYPYFRSDDHDTIITNMFLGHIKDVPLPPPEDNADYASRTITLEPDGTMHMAYDSRSTGSTESGIREWIRSVKPEEYEKQIRASVAAMTADYVLELATYSNPLDFSGPMTRRTVYTLNKFAPRSGKYMIFEIPNFRMNFPEVGLQKRTYDIQYTTSMLSSQEFNIRIPEGFTVKYLPSPVHVKNDIVQYDLDYQQKDREIKVTRSFAVFKRRVPVSEYLSYKECLEKIARSTEERIFLEETSPKGGTK